MEVQVLHLFNQNDWSYSKMFPSVFFIIQYDVFNEITGVDVKDLDSLLSFVYSWVDLLQ